jgi:thioredoxin 2
MDTSTATADIVRCPQCRAGNRVPAEKSGSPAAKCGRCGARLFPEPAEPPPEAVYKVRCAGCGTKNRVAAGRLDASPLCGKCKQPLPTRDLLAPAPVFVTDDDFEEKVLKSPLPVLLFAWAPWCPSCGAVTPTIEQFARESAGRVRVGKVNIDTSKGLADRFSIMSVPFLFVFDNGELKESMPGGLQKHELMLKMARYL